jgi:hypothetical protein
MILDSRIQTAVDIVERSSTGIPDSTEDKSTGMIGVRNIH